ncbi:Rne/Rng family ribonuclease [Sedimentitalea todarodis]|uniref:Ribonuclease E n=1 Tax=Sedimentitalea todarodis TaxID=1631240 RepID=A0ABU3VKU8_9RHOB|nr:Rne/Rng family ribonuclease [Sedimentitalea todarodis]MDU9006814.1 Rne/Rng family ribonuclease [Sedimentitalea todarodis]
MAKKMLIDATHAEETRVVVVDGNKVEEFDFESENKRQLAGNIYLAKVTRVEPSLQAAFVDYGGNRHGFLAFSEIHPDYYQIPVADREALMEEERAYAEAMKARDEEEESKPTRSRRSSRSRSRTKAAETVSEDAKTSKEVESEINGMETIDLTEDDAPEAADVETPEGTSPMELVAETPVEEPEPDASDDDTSDDDDVVEELEADDTDSDDDELTSKGNDPAAKDDSIESVADDDDVEDIRPPRKPRPRRYKIQEVIKVRQILLVQVVKEERGNKGAALTTYLSLAGRYCVLMPNTARGGGISRKITNAADRKKLKEIASEIEVPKGAGLIVRTAGAKRTKTEIKRDYDYLKRLWEQIRELTLKSIAPAKIYEEGDLIKRSIRDLYNRDIDEVFVEGERGYRIAKDFMKMIMPSHAKNVKQYSEQMPLFARHQVESYLGAMFNPTVQLKSGGYIVIGVTEALVAIDVNSGRATKEGSIEDTATKTNLEAAEEVARQLRLRDLAGLIVIDFIDMDERKNNAAVEKKIKDKLKSDRARIQVGRISGFGLLEMSRQRLRPGMIEATTQPCAICHGTGLIRSDDNMALSILRQIEEEGVRRRSREVLVKCPVNIANFLMNQKREHVAQIEMRYGLSVRIEGDPHLVSPDFAIEKFKTASRVVPVAVAPVVSVDTSLMDQVDSDEAEAEAEIEEPVAAEAEETETKPKRKRRRRRRRSKSGSYANGADDEVQADTAGAEASEENAPEQAATQDAEGVGDTESDSDDKAEDAPKSSRGKSSGRSRSSRSKSKASVEAADAPQDAAVAVSEPESTTDEAADDKPKAKPTRTRSSRSKSKPKATSGAEAETVAVVATKAEDPAPEPAAESLVATPQPVAEEPTPVPEPVAAEATPEAVVDEPAPAPEPVAPVQAPEPVAVKPEPEELATQAEPAKPKRRGWWSLGS